VEREISSGAMLGIVLLALAAVIGLGFGVFSIAKGIANEGTVNVQDSLGAVSLQIFMDYDQKVITGTQAVAAIKSFEGKPYAVLIATKALNGDQAVASDRGTSSPAYLVRAGTTTFINYNAVLASGASGGVPENIVGGVAKTALTAGGVLTTVVNTNGTYIPTYGFSTAGGEVRFDNATGGVFKSGNAEYIPSSTKFGANLLKDASGSVMGVVLKQL
jgi:CheY-like chemotaxis protein